MSDIKELTIQVRDTSPFYYGMKLYVIDTAGHKTLFEKCPICDDTGSITYRGYTFSCPECKDQHHNRETGNRLELSNYCITDYFINHLEIEGETTKSLYEGTNILNHRFAPRVRYKGFSKKGNSFDCAHSKIFWESDMHKEDSHFAEYGSVFSSKAEAQKCIRRLHRQQEEALKEFNKKHGTDYAYPFEYK